MGLVDSMMREATHEAKPMVSNKERLPWVSGTYRFKITHVLLQELVQGMWGLSSSGV